MMWYTTSAMKNNALGFYFTWFYAFDGTRGIAFS